MATAKKTKAKPKLTKAKAKPKPKTAGTRRSTLRNNSGVNKRRKGMLAVALPWLKRFGIIAACVVGVVWCAAWFFLSDADTRMINWTRGKIIDASAGAGFKVEEILVDGRIHSDPEILMALININKGDPLFAFNPKDAQALIEQITWVDSAHVERRWPGTIYIQLKEREAAALWKREDSLKLIDRNGGVIMADDIAPFKDLVIVLGENAPDHAQDILNALNTTPDIMARVDSAGLISDRRWDIVLKNGIRVKLPEDNVGQALERLLDAQVDDDLLSKDLQVIDLRDPTRMVVRTAPGAAYDYKKSRDANANPASQGI